MYSFVIVIVFPEEAIHSGNQLFSSLSLGQTVRCWCEKIGRSPTKATIAPITRTRTFRQIYRFPSSTWLAIQMTSARTHTSTLLHVGFWDHNNPRVQGNIHCFRLLKVWRVECNSLTITDPCDFLSHLWKI